MTNESDWIMLRHAALLYDVSEAALTKYYKRGHIKHRKEGRYRMLSRASIESYLAESDALQRIAVNRAATGKRQPVSRPKVGGRSHAGAAC